MDYIALSVIQSVLILITFKLFDRYGFDNLQAIVVNYIVAGFFGFLISRTEWSGEGLMKSDWFNTAIVLGVMFISTFFVFALSSQKAGVAVTSVTSKISLVIPVIASTFLFAESLNWLRISGIILALAAFFLVFIKKESFSWNTKYTWLPILVFTGNGIIDTTMKYADHHFIRNDLVLFLAVVFSTAFLIGFTILITRILSGKTKLHWKNLAGGAFLGLINFGSTYFMLKAISAFESSVVFPVTNASIVGLSSLTGYFIFKEKLSWLNWSGIILALIAIIIISNV
jgi:drug/metabolite transporter (DMT)-like permease